jgi:Pathogenicity locus
LRNIKTKNNELLGLANIGPATAGDLAWLGVTSIEKLKECDAHELYDRISALDGVKHDICVLDTFTAIIENAKTGEAKPWWYYSRLRKGESK